MFLYPIFLYLLLPLVLILFYFLMTQAHKESEFFSEDVMQKLRVNSNSLTLKARNAIFLLTFVCMIIALAQPVIEDGKVKVKAKSADIMVALDISDSMLAEDVYPSRLKSSKEKILTFLHDIKQERVGVMGFAKEAYLVAPLSFDKGAVAYLLKQLQPSSITEKGTNFMQLLNSANEMLKENKNKNLLIFSDGGDEDDFSDAITFAKENGITVFIIGMGSEKGAPIKMKSGGFIKQNGSIIISKFNPNVKALALESGGAFIQGLNSDEDIEAMLSEITRKTTKIDLEEEEITRYIPLFYYPLLLSMVLLVIATSSMSRRKTVALPSMFIWGFLLLHVSSNVDASLLDFKYIQDAESAYARGDYNKSASIYSKLSYENSSKEARFNAANSFYKMGEFKKASDLYKKIEFEDEKGEFNRLSNLGDSYTQQAKQSLSSNDIEGFYAHLEDANQTYNKAFDMNPNDKKLLKIKKAVEDDLKEKPKPEEKQDEENKENKDDKKESDDKKDSDKDQESKDKEKSDNKDKESKEKQDSKDKDSKKDESKKSENKDTKPQDKEGDKSEEEKAQEQAKKEKEEQDKKEKEKAQAQKSDKEKEEDMKQLNQAQAEENPTDMSDKEQKKWFKILNKKPTSHIYKMAPMQNREEDTNENPW